MKLKTIIVKSETGREDRDFNKFLEAHTYVHHSSTVLVKEEDGYYWHIAVMYEPKWGEENIKDKAEVENYLIYNRAVSKLLEKYWGKASVRSLNIVNAHRIEIRRMKTLAEIGTIRTVGEKMLRDDKELFEAALALARKYQKMQRK